MEAKECKMCDGRGGHWEAMPVLSIGDKVVRDENGKIEMQNIWIVCDYCNGKGRKIPYLPHLGRDFDRQEQFIAIHNQTEHQWALNQIDNK